MKSECAGPQICQYVALIVHALLPHTPHCHLSDGGRLFHFIPQIFTPGVDPGVRRPQFNQGLSLEKLLNFSESVFSPVKWNG